MSSGEKMATQPAQSTTTVSTTVSTTVPTTVPTIVGEPTTRSVHARLYRILILNDEVTPFGYVILLLEDIFELSLEMAEHVAWMAHSQGSAVVRICPKPEAEKLVARAHSRAQRDGFPLAFDLQPE